MLLYLIAFIWISWKKGLYCLKRYKGCKCKKNELLSDSYDETDDDDEKEGEEDYTPPLFEPTRFIWVIAANARYDILRQKRGLEDLKDLEDTVENIKSVQKGIKGLGASQDDIMMVGEADTEAFKKLFTKITDKVKVNKENGEMTLIFFYYVGYGATIDGKNHALLNARNNTFAKFALQDTLEALGKQVDTLDTFVLGLIDCSRIHLPQSMLAQTASTPRGAKSNPDEEQQVGNIYKNYVLTFSCKDRERTVASPSTTNRYFNKLKVFADPSNGAVKIPCDKFSEWAPNDKGEHIIEAESHLTLEHSDWEPLAVFQEGDLGEVDNDFITMNSNKNYGDDQKNLNTDEDSEVPNLSAFPVSAV